jgi:hypothetical protein
MTPDDELEKFDAETLLAEIRRRADEGEIDLTEALWGKMEPDEEQVIKLCHEHDVELFDQDSFDDAVHDEAVALLEDSEFFRLVPRIAFASSKADFIAALNDLRFRLKAEHNIYHGRLL